jgi:hypothetical protein
VDDVAQGVNFFQMLAGAGDPLQNWQSELEHLALVCIGSTSRAGPKRQKLGVSLCIQDAT